MIKKGLSLPDALSARTQAKKAFTKIADDKKSNRKQLLEAYKKYRKADDNLINVYERLNYDKYDNKAA